MTMSGVSSVADLSMAFISESRMLLTTEFLPKIERAVGALGDADVWWRPNEASNSVGNLLLHLCGNVSQWILEGVGGRPFERHRQEEFDERRPLAAALLLARIRSVMQEADEVLGALEPGALLETRRIQGYDTTVFAAVYHVVEHFSMHTGQIIWIAKARTGTDLSLWQPPQP